MGELSNTMDETASKEFLKKIEALPKNATFRKQWVLKQLLKLAENESTPVQLLDRIMSEQKITTVSNIL
jgi:hypothetical protein